LQYMSDEARLQRARARRRHMVIRRVRVGDRFDVVPITGADAIALAARLSRQAWTLAERELPDCDRKTLRYRFVPNQRAT
jgi:16S rRNA U1498 N3-methylase RsmE